MPPTALSGISVLDPRLTPTLALRREEIASRLYFVAFNLAYWLAPEDDSMARPPESNAETEAAWDGWLEVLTDSEGRATGSGYMALHDLHARLERKSRDLEDASIAAESGIVRGFVWDDDWGDREEHVRDLTRDARRYMGRADGLKVFLELFEGAGLYGPWSKLRAAFGVPNVSTATTPPMPPGLSDNDHKRILEIAEALALAERRASQHLDFDGQTEVFMEWAGRQINASKSTARSVLQRAGIVNGEGKSGSAGKGLHRRLANLRSYGHRFGVANSGNELRASED